MFVDTQHRHTVRVCACRVAHHLSVIAYRHASAGVFGLGQPDVSDEVVRCADTGPSTTTDTSAGSALSVHRGRGKAVREDRSARQRLLLGRFRRGLDREHRPANTATATTEEEVDVAATSCGATPQSVWSTHWSACVCCGDLPMRFVFVREPTSLHCKGNTFHFGQLCQ